MNQKQPLIVRSPKQSAKAAGSVEIDSRAFADHRRSRRDPKQERNTASAYFTLTEHQHDPRPLIEHAFYYNTKAFSMRKGS
ncbi:unnamed protein product [Colias eurytheme]|nr:unnamed protein product [Colias eurytheme]